DRVPAGCPLPYRRVLRRSSRTGSSATSRSSGRALHWREDLPCSENPGSEKPKRQAETPSENRKTAQRDEDGGKHGSAPGHIAAGECAHDHDQRRRWHESEPGDGQCEDDGTSEREKRPPPGN